MHHLFVAAFASLLIIAPALADRAPSAKAETVTVSAGKAEREFILYAPAPGATPRPVVLVFHGGGGSAEWMAKRSGDFTRSFTAAGYAVVYMNGSTKRRTDQLRTWNAVHCCAYAAKVDINEAVFADAVVDALDSRLDIDRTRIFLMGHSNGAMLSYRLAGQMKTAPRAIAPVSGAIFADQPVIPARTSIFMYHAVDDDVLSYDGNPDDKAERWRTAPHLGFVKAEAKLADMKGCTAPIANASAPGVTITARTCVGSSTLTAVTGLSGGHEWPARPASYDIEGAILAFFESQR